MIIKAPKLIHIAAIWLMMAGKALSIINCFKQNTSTSSRGEGIPCIHCYNSTTSGVFGSCVPLTTNLHCDQINTENSTECFKCLPEYFLFKTNHSCVQMNSTHSIPKCVNSRSSYASGARMDCTECSNGIPSIDLKSCVAFSEAKTNEKVYLENCFIGRREIASASANCIVCKDGYALDTFIGECVQTNIRGCFEAQKGLCISCRAFDGYFSDGFNQIAVGMDPICRTKEEHEWIPKYVPTGQKIHYADIGNKSIADLIPEDAFKNSDLSNFADFKNGYIVINKSVENYAINTNDEGVLRMFNFGSKIGKNLPYYRGLKYYSEPGRTSELFKCFFFQKMCVVLNDTSSPIKR